MSARWQRFFRSRPGKGRRTATAGGRWPKRRAAEATHQPPGETEPRGTTFPIAFVAEPELEPTLRARALRMITDQGGRAPRPVLHARLSVRVHPDPALERPVVVKAMLDVSGRPVRARATADSVENALDLIDERLRRNLEELEERRRAHRHETGTPTPGEWRHGDRATRPSGT